MVQLSYRQNDDFPYKWVICKENHDFAFSCTTSMVDIYLRERSKAPENPRNRVFASSRYGLNKISSKNINFSQSYSFRKIRDPMVQESGIKKNTLIARRAYCVGTLKNPCVCVRSFVSPSVRSSAAFLDRFWSTKMEIPRRKRSERGPKKGQKGWNLNIFEMIWSWLELEV